MPDRSAKQARTQLETCQTVRPMIFGGAPISQKGRFHALFHAKSRHNFLTKKPDTPCRCSALCQLWGGSIYCSDGCALMGHSLIKYKRNISEKNSLKPILQTRDNKKRHGKNCSFPIHTFGKKL